MLASDRIKLLFGPYPLPRLRQGVVLFDEARDCEVVVWGLTDGRFPWPIEKPKGGRARSLIVFGGLADAVRRESAIAICYWWGVTGQTVTKWRKALGVPVTNEGTHRLRSEYTDEPWSIEARKKGQAKNGEPQRREKIAAAKRGVPRPWSVIKKLIAAGGHEPIRLIGSSHRSAVGVCSWEIHVDVQRLQGQCRYQGALGLPGDPGTSRKDLDAYKCRYTTPGPSG